MRTITHSEFQAASGEGVYVSTVHYASAAERAAGDAAVQRVVVAAAFVPFGDKGEPFDPPEEWPSDKTAAWVGPPEPKTHFDGIPIRLPDGQLNPVAISAVIRKVKADQMPPNCDGYGEFVAQAAHTAAEGDGECSTIGCVIPQIKDNGSD